MRGLAAARHPWHNAAMPPARAKAVLAAALILALALASCASAPRSELARGWYELGTAWFDKGEWKKAGEAFSRAFALDPELKGASFNLARSLAEAGDYATALVALDALNEEDPGNTRIIATRAFVQYKSGDAAAALASYEELLALEPDAPDAVYNAALLRRAAGDRERAAEELGRLLAARGEDGQAWLLLGLIRSELGLRDEAIAAFEAARKLGKADAEALERLGLLYAEARRFSEAMESLAASVQADAARKLAWFSLARLRLVVAEDGGGGLEALKKALEAGFADREAAEALLAEPVLAEREEVTRLLTEKGLSGAPSAAAEPAKAGAEAPGR